VQTEYVKAETIDDEDAPVVIGYHKAFLPNPGEFTETVGRQRTVSGRLQVATLLVKNPGDPVTIERQVHPDPNQPKIREQRFSHTMKTEHMYLLERLDGVEPMPTVEFLVQNQLAILTRPPSQLLRTLSSEFPRAVPELFMTAPSQEGILFNSGNPETGGLYLLFASDIEHSFDIEVAARLLVYVANN
jgi:hypothetical protein